MRKKKTIETKVFKFRPFIDVKGRYIPYCNFGYHQGIACTKDICEERKCKHYHKLYINNENQEYGDTQPNR